MTIIEYLLIGSIAAAAVYTVCRLFLGWRNSTFPHGRAIGGERNVPAKGQPAGRVTTSAPWKRCEEAID
jgi:hypothetical protein